MNPRLGPIPLAAVLAVLGCAPSDVNTTYATTIQMPRPERVLIYDFAVSADEVHLDRGVVGKIEACDTNMESGYMRGMAETRGAGGLGGHLAVAAAAGVVTHGLGEKLSADVDAEARRTADALAKQLEPYFRSHGWLAREF